MARVVFFAHWGSSHSVRITKRIKIKVRLIDAFSGAILNFNYTAAVARSGILKSSETARSSKEITIFFSASNQISESFSVIFQNVRPSQSLRPKGGQIKSPTMHHFQLYYQGANVKIRPF